MFCVSDDVQWHPSDEGEGVKEESLVVQPDGTESRRPYMGAASGPDCQGPSSRSWVKKKHSSFCGWFSTEICMSDIIFLSNLLWGNDCRNSSGLGFFLRMMLSDKRWVRKMNQSGARPWKARSPCGHGANRFWDRPHSYCEILVSCSTHSHQQGRWSSEIMFYLEFALVQVHWHPSAFTYLMFLSIRRTHTHGGESEAWGWSSGSAVCMASLEHVGGVKGLAKGPVDTWPFCCRWEPSTFREQIQRPNPLR